MEAAGLWITKEYICRQQDTIAEYIANRTIYEICTGAEQMQGSIRFLQWWDQDLTREEEGDCSNERADSKVG